MDYSFQDATKFLSSVTNIEDIASGKKVIIDTDRYLELINAKHKDQFIELTIETIDYIVNEDNDKRISYNGITSKDFDISDIKSLKELNDTIIAISKNVNLYGYIKEELEKTKSKLSNSVYWEEYYRKETAKLNIKVSELEKLKIPFYKRIFIKNNKKA